jgi:hypothetical protein
MTSKDLRHEIQKSLEHVPESVLKDIYDFLKQVESQPADRVNLTRHLAEILREDRKLLEKLAK